MTPQMLLTLGFSGVLAALIACWLKIKPATSRLRSVLSVEPIFWFLYC